MIEVCLAELNISIENKYEYTAELCRDYICTASCDFSVSVSDFEIEGEDCGKGADCGYLESLAIYRKIAEALPKYNGFLMHGVLIEAGGCGIAFLAKSGIGKSTHARLWRELLGDKMKFINGDKPIIRVINEKVFAYGTPWAGKENLQCNAKTELKKICFIERSEKNECVKLERQEVLERLVKQIYIPKNKDMLLKTFELAGKVIESAEFYLIKCNKDISAAKMAYEVVFR